MIKIHVASLKSKKGMVSCRLVNTKIKILTITHSDIICTNYNFKGRSVGRQNSTIISTSDSLSWVKRFGFKLKSPILNINLCLDLIITKKIIIKPTL